VLFFWSGKRGCEEKRFQSSRGEEEYFPTVKEMRRTKKERKRECPSWAADGQGDIGRSRDHPKKTQPPLKRERLRKVQRLVRKGSKKIHLK